MSAIAFVPAQETPAIDGEEKSSPSTLVSRNITLYGRRTSMRLEPAMWDALSEICRREKLSIHQLCGVVFERKPKDTAFTAAMRVFVMTYFRAAATEDGHVKTGHGSTFLFSANKDFVWFTATAPRKPVLRVLPAGSSN